MTALEEFLEKSRAHKSKSTLKAGSLQAGYSDGSGKDIITMDGMGVLKANWGCGCCEIKADDKDFKNIEACVFHLNASETKDEMIRIMAEALQMSTGTFSDPFIERERAMRVRQALTKVNAMAEEALKC